MALYPKDPASNVDFSIDWSSWLQSGETIASANWSVEPSGDASLSLGAQTSGSTVTSVFVSGGVAGHRYRLTCLATSSEGRAAERSITLRIMEQ